MASSPDRNRPDIAALVKADDRAGLRRCLEDADASIRARAADGVAQLGDRASAPMLRAALRADPDDHVREEAAVALGKLGDAEAIDDVIAALRSDRSEHVREEAALALGSLGATRGIDALLDAMGDRYTMVHRAAAEALEALGPEAQERLRALAAGSRTDASQAARAALEAREGLRSRPQRGAGG